MALAVFATVGGAMVASSPAFASVDVDKLTIGGEIRERYEFRTNDTFNSGGCIRGINCAGTTGFPQKGNESLGSHRVRVSVGYDLTPDVTFFAQIADARNFGSECSNPAAGGSSGAQCVSNTNSQQTGTDLHQGYILVKNVLVRGLSLKLGRQEIKYGDHRLFGDFAWSQIGNAFDAAKIMYSTEKADVDFFWARIVDPAATAFQNANNNIPFPAAAPTATQSTANQDIYGAYVTLKPVKNWTLEPYWFLLQDARAVNNQGTAAVAGSSFGTVPTASNITGAQAPGQTRNTVGARLNGKQAGLDLTLEGMHQFGSITSQCFRNQGGNTAAGCGRVGGTSIAYGANQIGGSRDLHINAEALIAKTGYTFEAVPMKPRLGFEFDYASGDPCANGPTNINLHGGCGAGKPTHFDTFDNLYPTNHFKYGAMDLESLKNAVIYQAVFDVKPSANSKLQINYAWDRLARATDNWYRAGQAVYFASKATNQAASLGRELNITYWHTFKEKFKFDIGYGHFWAGEYIEKSVNFNRFGPDAFSGGQGSASNGFIRGSNITGQNWGYVMGSILF